MTTKGFIDGFNALLEKGDHEELRATQVAAHPEGRKLHLAGATTLQHLISVLKRDEVLRFLQSWTDADLLVSVDGEQEAEPTPAALVRDGKVLVISGAQPFGGGPSSSSFSEWFMELIGAPLPIQLDLVRLDENAWGTVIVRGRQVEGFPHVLRVDGVESYSLVAFASHGINSYALYVTRVHHQTQMYLRLPWGGVYTKPETARPRLLKALAEANELFELAAEKGVPLWLNKNMGTWSFSRSSQPIDQEQEHLVVLTPVRDFVLSHPGTSQ